MGATDVIRLSLRALDGPRRRLWRDPVYIPGGFNRLIVAILRWMPRRMYARLADTSFSLAEK
jgi:hypothetical protein